MPILGKKCDYLHPLTAVSYLTDGQPKTRRTTDSTKQRLNCRRCLYPERQIPNLTKIAIGVCFLHLLKFFSYPLLRSSKGLWKTNAVFEISQTTLCLRFKIAYCKRFPSAKIKAYSWIKSDNTNSV